MFTGIVQARARIQHVHDHDGLRTLTLAFPSGFCDGLQTGASVATDGVCLTVTAQPAPDVACFDIIAPTLAITTLGLHRAGQEVNVERAAREGAEIGGHTLSGHIDGTAQILHITHEGDNYRIRFALPAALRPYVFERGYIAIDGASLTVAQLHHEEGWFEVGLIPETRRATTLQTREVGDHVNIEIDRSTQALVDTVRRLLPAALAQALPGILPQVLPGMMPGSDHATPPTTTHG